MRYPHQVTVALAVGGLAGCSREKEQADLVLRGGEVYTVDAARSWASAIAVRDGRIVYVGSDSLPRGLIGPGTRIVELAGAMVLPGFQDAHVHPISSGVELTECHLHSLTTAVAVLDSIRACALARADRPWVRGSGWQLPIFPRGNPSRLDLDRAVPDRPALFYAADGHQSSAICLSSSSAPPPTPLKSLTARAEVGERCDLVAWAATGNCASAGYGPAATHFRLRRAEVRARRGAGGRVARQQ